MRFGDNDLPPMAGISKFFTTIKFALVATQPLKMALFETLKPLFSIY